MIFYELITETQPRVVTYPSKRVILPRLTDTKPNTEEHQDWAMRNWWMIDFTVHERHKSLAVQLANCLHALYTENPSHPEIPAVVERLKALHVKAGDRPLDQWVRSGYQLANYAGPEEVWRAIISRLRMYTGNILEAMCGHHSYFTKNDWQHITALDYCRISLERYHHPHARRYCCDLNQVTSRRKLPFLKCNTFDAVSICFGYKYPDNIVSVMREFKRILRHGGTLSCIESDSHGYVNLKKREFCPSGIVRDLRKAGFKKIEVVPLCKLEDFNDYIFHVQAIK